MALRARAQRAARLSNPVQFLNSLRVHLGGVQRVTLSLSKKGPGLGGARHFLRERMPQLKYHNSDVQFAREHTPASVMPRLVVERVDGTRQELDLHRKTEAEILAEFLAAVGAKAEVEPDAET